MVLALRLRWPDLTPLVVSQGTVGLQLIEQEQPDFVIICEDLPNLGMNMERYSRDQTVLRYTYHRGDGRRGRF